jgi:HSP20 family protein
MATKKQDQEATQQGAQQPAQQGSEQARQGSQAAQQSGGQGGHTAQGSQGGQGTELRQGGRAGQTGLSRRGEFMPSFFASSPFELMRMSPFTLIRRFSEEMDRMFEDFGFGGNLSAPQAGGGGLEQRGGFGQGFFAPQVEVFEREGQLVVRADLPGVTKDDVRVEVTDEGLLLEGERRYEHQENRGGVYRSERSYGTFRRLIPLPEGVNPEDAHAQFQNGVLEITMQAPRRQSRGRQIEIQGESGAGRQQGREPQQQGQAQTAGRR